MPGVCFKEVSFLERGTLREVTVFESDTITSDSIITMVRAAETERTKLYIHVNCPF